jgi:bile acid-coenzyme A ligase
VDLIISGGANIYPAEVEAALTEHPSVADVAVIPIPDQVWGKRVHAVIQPRNSRELPSLEELDAHCRARILAYKCPKSYEFLEDFPREPTGKIRRSALAEARASGWSDGMLVVKSATS